MTHNNPAAHWRNQHGNVTLKPTKIKETLAEYDTGKYIDTHAWFFTPNSFSQIIQDLFALGYIDLSIEAIDPTPYNHFEFYVKLRKHVNVNEL
jgi:hypothetical protein